MLLKHIVYSTGRSFSMRDGKRSILEIESLCTGTDSGSDSRSDSGSAVGSGKCCLVETCFNAGDCSRFDCDKSRCKT